MRLVRCVVERARCRRRCHCLSVPHLLGPLALLPSKPARYDLLHHTADSQRLFPAATFAAPRYAPPPPPPPAEPKAAKGADGGKAAPAAADGGKKGGDKKAAAPPAADGKKGGKEAAAAAPAGGKADKKVGGWLGGCVGSWELLGEGAGHRQHAAGWPVAAAGAARRCHRRRSRGLLAPRACRPQKDKGAAPATPAASAEAGAGAKKGGAGADSAASAGSSDCAVDLLDIRVGQIVKVRAADD